jgi:nucleoid-associated protein YgaU
VTPAPVAAAPAPVEPAPAPVISTAQTRPVGAAAPPAVAAPAPAPAPAPNAGAAPAVAAPAAPQDVAVAAALPELGTSIPNDTPYVVVPGDTLWKICLKAYGPDVAPSMISRVMSKNRIVSDVRLLWGKTIILPSPKNS